MRRRPGRRAGGRSRARRALETFAVLAVLAAAAIGAAIFDELAMRDLSGPARAVDGDTLVMAGERIRLASIDAPELEQRCLRDGAVYQCGRAARLYLADLLGDGDVMCRGNERDRYGRLLMRCVSRGREVNADMVLAGWAVAYGGYEDAERTARRDAAGLWAGDFDPPSEWRAQRGSLADAGPAGMARRLLLRLGSFLGIDHEKDNP